MTRLVNAFVLGNKFFLLFFALLWVWFAWWDYKYLGAISFAALAIAINVLLFVGVLWWERRGGQPWMRLIAILVVALLNSEGLRFHSMHQLEKFMQKDQLAPMDFKDYEMTLQEGEGGPFTTPLEKRKVRVLILNEPLCSRFSAKEKIAGARVVPYMGKDNKLIGFLVGHIKEKGFWAELGIQNKDVIVAVNGESVGEKPSLMNVTVLCRKLPAEITVRSP